MDNMKMAMRARRTKGKQRGNRATVIAPFLASSKSAKGPNVSLLMRKPRKTMLSKISELVFFVWGLVICTLHLYAESSSQPPQCWMQVKPWVSLQPSCSLLVLDCNQDQLSGTKKEVALQWSAFSPKTVVRVVVKHCPALELPETLKAISDLNAMKIYNSTIVAWDNSAAITQSDHPKLMTLFLVRVSFPNGELPLGLQAKDFPQGVSDIEFCVTNLNSLPDDLELKWPQYASIYIEASQLTEVPESLVRLAPFDLSLSVNPITTLPVGLFEQGTVAFLSFGSTLIQQLPEKVTKLSSLLCNVNLSYNNVSFFWSWMDPIVAQSGYQLLSLVHTPYCWDLERIIAGEQISFSVSPPVSKSDENLPILSDASRDNWATLQKVVNCKEEEITWYPIDLEDRYSGLT